MAGNRIFRGACEHPRVISDRTVSGALLPATGVSVGASTLTQATTPSAVRLALLMNRDYYGLFSDSLTTTNPLLIPYVSGETGLAMVIRPGDEVVWAMAAGTYTNGQELTVGASGRLTAAATTNVVVAYYDQTGATLAAGDLADVCVANFYTKA